jgi:hypothetical protein
MLARRGNGDITGTDMISSIQTRMSMEARRSQSHRISIGSSNRGGGAGDRDGLMRAYDEEEAAGFGLTDLAEDTDETGDDDDPRSPMIPAFPSAGGRGNGHPPNGNGRLGVKNGSESIELQSRKSGGER